MNILRPLFFSAFFMIAATSSQAKVLGTHGDWLVFSETENGNLTCVMSSEPKKSAGKYKKRGKIFAVISHRPSEKRLNEFSFQAGYNFKKGVDVAVNIDGKTNLKLFTNGEHAWAIDAQGDKELVRAMRAGNKMIVKGISARGTKTTDTFSLKGFTAAMKSINTACKVK